MSGVDEVRAELLSPAELDARIAENPLAYLPLGTLEFHGPHLPIGLDALNAHAVCIEAAAQGGGLVLPPVYQGFGGGHGHYPWTIMMNDGAGIDAHLRSTLTRLGDFGITTAVVFSGHFAPEQLDLIDALQDSWNAEEQPLRVIATSVDRCPSSPLPPDHAGEFETTLLAGSAPDLIHLDRLPSIDAHPADDPDGDPYGLHRHERAHPVWGVFGPDPRRSDLPSGRALLRHFGDWLAGAARGDIPVTTP
ncbi:creatininase family protein [Microbacterium profundi]|uniref:creatininase family protein n=1 Tax=Microbacterium profundi TaxID=450380 RepID=UPI001F36D81F|nr:creatininase family protein [Microbacterium profundi]MCE7481202.1 creatininase family protein [Microbacterium profundi]